MSLDLLVFGDSIMWGQGLQDADKFWAKTRDFVASALNTQVNTHVYAHSGARIVTADSDAKSPLWGEAPVDWPSVTRQVEQAKIDLPSLSQAGLPCLILVNGGINDISLGTILTIDPSITDKPAWVSKLTQQDIGPRIQQLLQAILAAFPNAFIVVTGYYQIISQNSNPTLVELALSALITLISPLLTAYVWGSTPSLISQSAAFAQQAQIGLEQAVSATNGAFAAPWNGHSRVFLASPAFGPHNALGADQSYIWNGTDDPIYSERCIWYRTHFFSGASADMPVASLGHPNVQGANAYADAIKTQLAGVLSSIPFLEARFVSQSVPAQVTARQHIPVTVVMQNSGTIPWTQGGTYPFRLGTQSPQDNTLWGMNRLDVPSVIAPGQQVTFNATLTAPALSGTYTLQWQMVQDGVTWFGGTTPAVTIQVIGGKGKEYKDKDAKERKENMIEKTRDNFADLNMHPSEEAGMSNVASGSGTAFIPVEERPAVGSQSLADNSVEE